MHYKYLSKKLFTVQKRSAKVCQKFAAATPNNFPKLLKQTDFSYLNSKVASKTEQRRKKLKYINCYPLGGLHALHALHKMIKMFAQKIIPRI